MKHLKSLALAFGFGFFLLLGIVYFALHAQATTVTPIFGGGTGTSTAPSFGKVLVGDSQGNYELTATSSLGFPVGGSGTITGIGPVGGSVTSGVVTLATTTSTTNGVISALTITTSGSTVNYQASQSGTRTVGGGGTGIASVADGALLFGGVGGGTANLSTLATSTAGSILQLSFTTGRPSYVATSSLGIALSDTTGTLALARGGTNATSFNTSGNAVYYDGTRLSTALTTAKITIPIASTTDITASGEAGIPNAATSPTLNSGEIAIATNAASSSMRFGDGTATRSLYATQTASALLASSSLAYFGSYGSAGSTTIRIENAYRPTTILVAMCKTDVGTANIDFYNGTSRSNNVACSTSPSWITLSSNNTWTMGQDVDIDVGDEASNPNLITVTVQIRADSD